MIRIRIELGMMQAQVKVKLADMKVVRYIQPFGCNGWLNEYNNYYYYYGNKFMLRKEKVKTT